MLQNNIAKKNDNQLVEFSANGEKVKLSPAIVRNYLVNGNGQITDQEVVYFINLCKSQGLNPFIKDCYLIKYGSTTPAQMVVSKDVFLKRAERNSEFDGFSRKMADIPRKIFSKKGCNLCKQNVLYY